MEAELLHEELRHLSRPFIVDFTDLADVGILLLDNDIPGLDESRLRGAGTRDAGPARACAVKSSGLDEPDTSVGRATCIGRILIGMKDLCRDNGLDESVTAEMVGRLAIDLCKLPI